MMYFSFTTSCKSILLNFIIINKHKQGGKMVLLLNAGKDASEQFNMIHPPDAPEKFAPYTIIGMLEGAAIPNPAGGAGAPLLLKDKKDAQADRTGPIEGEGDYGGCLGALFYMLKSAIFFLVYTIFSNVNFEFKFKNDRMGLSLSAVFLLLFI